jgi:hypothetical protein
VSAGPGGVDEQRREALHPAEHGDVIDLDPTLGKEFLDITKGQPEPEIPANREDDHLGREPEPDKRCNRDRGYPTNIKSAHPTTVALGHDNRLTQQSHLPGRVCAQCGNDPVTPTAPRQGSADALR